MGRTACRLSRARPKGHAMSWIDQNRHAILWVRHQTDAFRHYANQNLENQPREAEYRLKPDH